MDTFDLKAYLKENYLFEEDTNIPDNILKLVAKTVNQPVDKVEKIVTGKEEVTEEELNEVGTMTAITIAGLIPAAMEAIGGLSNWIARNTGKNPQQIAKLKKINKAIEEKEEYIKKLDKKDSKKEFIERDRLKKLIKQRDDEWGSDFGQWMKKKGHDLHHVYTWPIRKLLQGISLIKRFFKKDSKLKDPKYREKVANVLYAITMAIVAGVGILSHLGHLHGVAAVSTTIADGVKEGKSIKDIVKAIDLAI